MKKEERIDELHGIIKHAESRLKELNNIPPKEVSPLENPSSFNLIDIFKELKFNRPAKSQQYLQKCINELEEEYEEPKVEEKGDN